MPFTTRIITKAAIGAVVFTIAMIALWQITGGDYFTKYEVVTTVSKPANPDDPFVQAGLYEDNHQTETAITNEFRFGLFPSTATPFDKHFVAVATLVPPAWVILVVVLWRSRRRAHALVLPLES